MNTSAVSLNGTFTWPNTNPPLIDQINRRALMAQFAQTALEGLLAREGSRIHKDSELVEQAWGIAKMMLDEGNNKYSMNAW